MIVVDLFFYTNEFCSARRAGDQNEYEQGSKECEAVTMYAFSAQRCVIPSVLTIALVGTPKAKPSKPGA